MIILLSYEQKVKIEELEERFEKLLKLIDREKLAKELEELERKMSNPNFWNDPKNASEINKKTQRIRKRLEELNDIEKMIEDLKVAVEFADEDEDMVEHIENVLPGLEKKIASTELLLLLNGKYDQNNAYLSIHPGAGGTESQDWAQMLFRMYVRWAEKKGFETDVVELQPGEEAGIKSATIHIRGDYAYGYLKYEKGIHRLVRISPFDASKRRHTSFASVNVLPELEDDIEIEIKPDDLRIDTFRASGHGGQHVNRTDSAVRITHIPTGIVVTCQNERSQLQNKATALKILKARLYELELEKRIKERQKIQGELKEIGWGNQIRSYVFHPYTLVKDHRTGYETSNGEVVMDGEIDGFIEAELHHFAKLGLNDID